MHRRLMLALLALLIAGAGTIAITAWSARYLLANQPEACPKTPTHHTITIQNDELSQSTVQARRCDQLTITNLDPVVRLIAFGEHNTHQAYSGVTERTLTQGDSLDVTLNQVGTYTFHDHLHDELEGAFTVTSQ